MTSLTLTPGSRCVANAVGHLIFYWLLIAATKTFYRLREGFILIVFTNGIFFIMFIIIHSKYFPDSYWLKAHV